MTQIAPVLYMHLTLSSYPSTQLNPRPRGSLNKPNLELVSDPGAFTTDLSLL